MTSGVDLSYVTADVRGGGAAAGATADAAGAVVDLMAKVVVDAAAFGDVDQAGPLAAALVVTRDGFTDLGRRVQVVHADLAQRAAAVAGDGDGLVDATTGRARSVPVPAVGPPAAATP